MTRSPAPILAALALTLTLSACGSDETLITNRVQMELDTCKAAAGDTHEFIISGIKPYTAIRSFCEVTPAAPVITKKIYAEVAVGPYKFKLRKNTSDGRWHINQIKWPELDEARFILTWDTVSDADSKKVLGLYAKVQTQAPQLREPYLKQLEILLDLRKRANKQKDPDPAGLGAEVTGYYKGALAAASKNEDGDLGAELRLMVVRWYDRYRTLAVDSSTVSASAAEWDQQAIKAVENEVKEAEAKGDKALAEKKLAEIEARKKEAEQNITKREQEAERMVKLAKSLKERECAEMKNLGLATPKSADLTGAISAARSLVSCP